MSPRIRAVGIVIRSEKILLIHRFNEGQEYWVFPGGGVEGNESIDDAVARELLEETSLSVRVGKLLYHLKYSDGSEQFFYLCEDQGGDISLSNDAPELEQENQSFAPEWVPLKDLSQLLVYPVEVRDQLLIDIADHFQSVSRGINIDNI